MHAFGVGERTGAGNIPQQLRPQSAKAQRPCARVLSPGLRAAAAPRTEPRVHTRLAAARAFVPGSLRPQTTPYTQTHARVGARTHTMDE